MFLITVCNFFVVEKTHVFSYLKYPPDVRICFSIVLVVQKTHVFPTIFSFLRVFFSIARLSLNPVCKLFVVGKTHVFSTKKNLSDVYILFVVENTYVFLNTLLPAFSWNACVWKNSRFPDYFSLCLFFLVGKTHVFSNTISVLSCAVVKKTHVFSTIFSIYRQKIAVFSLFWFTHITNLPKTNIFGIFKKNWQCVSKMSE